MRELILQPQNGKELLSRMLERAGVSFDLPCGGNHTCGKCKVRVIGQLDDISESEAAMLSDEEIANGFRLACFAYALDEVTVYLPKYASVRILTDTGAPIAVDRPLMEKGKFGAAVDIGTTTVVCKLYDAAGRELAVDSAMNAEGKYGADVISRIHYGMQQGNAPISRAIITQVESMLSKLAAQAGGSISEISHAVVVGNTTMLHFFANLDPGGIGAAPFTPASLFDKTYEDIIPGVKCYLPPCISAYVGADLVACLLAADILSQKKTALLVDIGTNGEMALTHQGSLFCCSTAAGPAFEGANISCGINAATGAIVHVSYDKTKEELCYDTLDDAAAIGICGSGIIDICAALLASGAMAKSGLLLDEGHPLAKMVDDEKKLIIPDSKVFFSQKDIRQVQLAKAAIHAGMVTLADYCSIGSEDLQILYLCGGFGSYLDLASAESIGLIPVNASAKTENLGNAALKGAAMLLLDQGSRDQLHTITEQCQYLELSGDQRFMDNYISSMSF